jgi:hypothetical protein
MAGTCSSGAWSNHAAFEERRNDISGQMRNVARQMTRDEIDAASRFYADRR